MLSNNILYASGVLFYGRSLDNTLFFLLGKDVKGWSNFGGGCELSDKGDVVTTAAREAWEESLGSIYDYDEMRRILRQNNKCIISKTPNGYQYSTYLVKIPVSQSYREKFKSTRKFLSKINNIDKKFFEMGDISWVSLYTLKNSINTNKPFIKLRNVFENFLLDNINDIVKYTNNQ